MKKWKLLLLICFALLLLGALFACEPLGVGFGTPRMISERRLESRHPDIRDSIAPPSVPDTTVYFAVTAFGEDYDWARDSAYSSSHYRIILYKDFSPALTLSSDECGCISPDSDFQHLIGGHLYTERAGVSHTVIGRDGVEVIRFEGRERLCGLVEKGSVIYTLSRSISDGHYSYRADGALLLTLQGCTVFGSFDDPSYLPCGALYEDDGEVCFCYLRSDGPASGKDYRIVRDGKDSPTGYRYSVFSDLRRDDGVFRSISTTSGSYKVTDGRVWRGKEHAVSGFFSGPGQAGCYAVVGDDGKGEFVSLGAEEQWIYHSEGTSFGVPAGGGPRLMHKDCAAAIGSMRIIGASPATADGKPYIMVGDKVTEIDAHGYISAVEAVVSPPN